MLTPEEIKKFLAILLAFARDTGCSGRNLSALFNVSVKTMARWVLAARGNGGVDRLYISRVEPIVNAINKMNAHDAKHKSYQAISKVSVPSKKLDALRAILAAK
jgi:hypothetical protein